MASSIDPMIVKLGLLGFGAYTAYGMALTGSLGGGARTFAYQLKSAWGNTPGVVTGLVPASGSAAPSQAQPASSSPNTRTASASTARYVNLGDTDLGHVPLVYDTQRKVIMQSPSWVSANASSYSPNTYGPNDVFLDASGNTISYDQALSQAGIQSA